MGGGGWFRSDISNQPTTTPRSHLGHLISPPCERSTQSGQHAPVRRVGLCQAIGNKNEVRDSNVRIDMSQGGPEANKRPKLFNMDDELKRIEDLSKAEYELKRVPRP